MPSTRELRRRIRSIKNTAQITKAMEMVAATKMRRAQLQALGGRPYNRTLIQLLHNLLSKSSNHPLFSINFDLSPQGLLLLTTDKSLCGALNTNLFRLIIKDDNNTNFYTVGAKARQFITKTSRNLVADFSNLETPTAAQARQIRISLVQDFLSGKISSVKLLFPNFISTLKQEPILVDLLPIKADSFLSFVESHQTESKTTSATEFIYEPDYSALLEFALVHFLDVTIYQALIETKASEHSARMIAMQNASNNAKDLVSELSLKYNQIRQESITKELLEITSASAALE